jgi:hypothetical protein
VILKRRWTVIVIIFHFFLFSLFLLLLGVGPIVIIVFFFLFLLPLFLLLGSVSGGKIGDIRTVLQLLLRRRRSMRSMRNRVWWKRGVGTGDRHKRLEWRWNVGIFRK